MATHFRPDQISLTDTQLIDLPKSQKASGIAMFGGDVQLPREAARIPAAAMPKTCRAHVDQPLAMRANWHVICTTYNPKQAGMWMSATLGIDTVHILVKRSFDD